MELGKNRHKKGSLTMPTENNDFMTKQMNLPQTELKPCPKCGEVPQIGYVCGEHFVFF